MLVIIIINILFFHYSTFLMESGDLIILFMVEISFLKI